MTYDVFIYGSGYKYLPLYLDRKIAHLMGKKIIEVFNGSDSRPPYLNGNFQDFSIDEIAKHTKMQSDKVKKLDKTAFATVDHPLYGQFHTKKCVNFLYIGCPFSLPDGPEFEENEKPMIVHAPSRAEIKGTDIIRNVIEELRADHDFEYVELQGVTHAQVLETLQKCSFCINELYSDTLMAGLDTESSWFGKPFVIAGYELDRLEKSINPNSVPPGVRIKPDHDTLKKTVIKLLEDEAHRKEIGAAAQKFVHAQWHSKTVAGKYLKIINNEANPDWFFDPQDIDYIHGCGIRNQKRQEIIKDLVKKHGKEALCLSDKPHLEKLILEDAGAI